MSTESSAISYSLAVSKAADVVMALLKKKVNFHTAVGKALKNYPTAGKRDVITTVNVRVAAARDRHAAKATEATAAG